MKKHINYPKIQQFRNVAATINREATFVGLDGNGDEIYNSAAKKPTITFNGTVKLHGSNASVCFNSEDGFWVQSRKNIITVEKDNAGFAFFAESRKAEFRKLLDLIIAKYKIYTPKLTVSIFGEWAGKGIQKGVGISQLEKAFYIFGVKISNPTDEEFKSYWVDSAAIRDVANNIYNVNDYTNFSIDIDFNTPQLAQNRLIEITAQVEKECPISKAFGIKDGLGEGVVWSGEYKGVIHRFKVKGEKHSVSKVKTLAAVNVEKINSINEFIHYAVTVNRFNQAVENIFGKEDLNVKKLGDLIRWIVKDITSEEIDTMAKNKLEPKDVNKYISNRVREMFFAAQTQF